MGNLNAFVQYNPLPQETWCIHVYFETSHSKSKSNGLGGLVKGYPSREVAPKMF